MKIIGQTGSGFILEATTTEVANLMGSNYENTIPVAHSYGPESGRHIGLEFAIHTCWNRLHKLNNERDSLNRVCGQLRAMAELLEPISNVIDTLDDEADEAGKDTK